MRQPVLQSSKHGYTWQRWIQQTGLLKIAYAGAMYADHCFLNIINRANANPPNTIVSINGTIAALGHIDFMQKVLMQS
ncbi:MAG: hypothetical protein IPF69_00170 [Chitinophagaceae bacterium]|nr:hypothetical protein [Chitinophagaceae bacterium]